MIASGIVYSIQPILNKGDRVRVIRGALAGVEGALVTGNSTARLLVSIEMIRQSLALSVSRADIEPVTKGLIPVSGFDMQREITERRVKQSVEIPWRRAAHAKACVRN